jgi:L-seryl-tRNA(Ser) seleniumtransferase
VNQLSENQYRNIPSIDELLRLEPVVLRALEHHSRQLVTHVLRDYLGSLRAQIAQGQSGEFSESRFSVALQSATAFQLRNVINATGVILHTNLGRAPLAASVAHHVATLAQGYCNLEFDLDESERGSRYDPVIELLKNLTGAQDALVVNNCAAAVMLMLSALAQGKTAVVSRGELVEIGGGFRIPDIMRQSGAHLIEVGTTNRTRLADYISASDSTAVDLIFKVHQSNFSQIGFVEETTIVELAKAFRAKNIPVVVDLGSGLLKAFSNPLAGNEMTVKKAIEAGAQLVAFSGDKLLGGPQCGIIVGETALIARLKSHALNRVVRVDKMTVAALEATLRLYSEGKEREIPARNFLERGESELKSLAETLFDQCAKNNLKAKIKPTVARVGGGCLPLVELPSFAVAIEGNSQLLHQQFRTATPSVVGRIEDDQFLLDVRCVTAEELSHVALVLKDMHKSERTYL